MKRRTQPLLLFAILALLAISCRNTGADSSKEPLLEGRETFETDTPQGFDVLSSKYYEEEARVIWQKPELVVDLLGDLTGKRVADIGAGTGYFAFRIAAGGGIVIAIDVDPRAISFMESESTRYTEEIQSRFSTRLAKPDDPMLSTAEVDMILMVNTYIYIEDRVEYFRRLAQGLRPGGQIVIVDFKKKETSIGPGIEDRVASNQVIAELARAGYLITETDLETLEYQYIIKAIRRE